MIDPDVPCEREYPQVPFITEREVGERDMKAGVYCAICMRRDRVRFREVWIRRFAWDYRKKYRIEFEFLFFSFVF